MKSSQAWVASGLGLFELGIPLLNCQGLKWLFLILPTLGPASTPSKNQER